MVIVGVVLIAAVYFISQGAPTQDDATIIESAYLGSGSALCTFIDPGSGEGVTAYIKEGKMRFFVEETEDYTVGNIIFKDNTYYFWDDEGGMKMTIEEDEEDTMLPFIVREGEVHAKSPEYQLDCRRTSIDDSMFDLPEDIEFFDLSGEYFDMGDYEYDEGDFEDFELDYEEYLKSLDPEMLEGIEGLEDFDF